MSIDRFFTDLYINDDLQQVFVSIPTRSVIQIREMPAGNLYRQRSHCVCRCGLEARHVHDLMFRILPGINFPSMSEHLDLTSTLDILCTNIDDGPNQDVRKAPTR